MEFPKREPALPQGSPRRSPKAMRPGAATEADENASPRRPVPAWAAPPQRTKVLGERNGGLVGGVEANASPPAPQPKPAPSPPTLTGRGAGPYDPKTNYTTPRPAFLRYDPERRREILLRVARTAEVEYDDCSSTASATAASEDDGGSVASDAAVASPVSSARTSDSEAELDDSNEEEEEGAPARRGWWARRLFLLLIAMVCSFCYMNPTAFPAYSEDDLHFIGPVGGIDDAGDHELDSLRLLGPVYMMGPEDVLEETTSQVVQQDAEDVVHSYGQRVSPRNLVAVSMMGLADICPNLSLGELTCQIGGESSENVTDLKEDSELHELEIEATIESFQNAEQSTEASCLSENISLDSIGCTCTHTAYMEEGGPVFQVEGEDHSDGFVLQLVSMATKMKSASDKLNDRISLESDDLDLWQYESTAEAAKEICSMVKILWSAMEPQLFQILACLCVTGMVAALFRYYQRSRQNDAPAPQHMTSNPLAEVPLLVPHQVVQLPVSASPQAVQLPEVKVPNQVLQLSGGLEVPMEWPLPKTDPFATCKDHVQESLPETGPFASPKVAMVDHGNCDQELQQGYPDNMKAYNGNFLNHRDVDSSKPPVVELLGEFTFANSSRGRPVKSSNQYAGDAAVQEFLTLLRKDVDKMQMDPSIIRSPSVRRERKEENPVNGEKTDVMPAPLTPTPLRRSNRLRNKVTSP